MRSARLLVIALLAFAACDDRKEHLLTATAPDAAATPPPPPPGSTPAATTSASAAPSASVGTKRFDPKYTCPTGQTHFYMEGDFCRRKCFTNADCGKKEHCSAMEYPFVVEDRPAGMSKFCEGT